MSRILDYSVLDVFAERPLEGNPLAVFHDARSLSDDEMQALARETNLAETTFILPGDDPEEERENGVRVRIFTTEEELPFAGHPTLGTATWLRLHHPSLRDAEKVTLRLNVGPISVTFEEGEAGIRGTSGTSGTMRQKDPVFGDLHDREAVARAIGMTVEDLLPGFAPQTVSTGLPFCIVPLRSVEVAKKLQIAQREAQEWLATSGAKFFYCVAPAETTDLLQGPHWHARMQFYNGEDPATGSASGCCISWLVQHELVPSGVSQVIEQGVEIHRPSLIFVNAKKDGPHVHSVLVTGRTIPVARGSFFLP